VQPATEPATTTGATTDRATDRGSGANLTVRRSRRTRWLLAAVTVAVVGVLLTVYADTSLTRATHQRAVQQSRAASEQIASSLNLAIQQESELLVAASAFFVTDPGADQAQFARWITAVRAFTQYPSLNAISEVTIDTPAELPAVSARQAGGKGAAGVGTTVQVIPPGTRPYYCLGTVWQSRGSQSPTPAGVDFCDTSYGPLFLKMRDTGQPSIVPYGSGTSAELGAAFPVYQGGVVPTTVAARRAAFIGWVAEEVDPRLFMATALRGHRDTAVTLSFRSGTTEAAFSAGSAPAGATATTIPISNGWHVTTRSVVGSGDLFVGDAALVRIGGGLLISLLLGALVYVMGTSRTRALQLVDERTVQLRHQALHDPLTGLPNRALILDRIDQMIARASRDRTRIAALYLDLDNFKQINDTLGHKVGDELLVGVGQRLTSALRDVDTVGRLGGDEFVVLVEGAALSGGTATVADRVLDALSGPFEFEGVDGPVWITVSIGIAEGARPSPERLLQDADIALYEAKATGKQHAMVFSRSMQEALDNRRSLEQDLHGALEAGEFSVRYRTATDLSTRGTAGVAARLCWSHASRGDVSPDVFGPVLEATGRMPEVARWLLRTVCADGAAWRRQGGPVTVSVTACRSHFTDDRFLDDVRQAVADSGIEPERLVITFPESVLGHDDEVTIGRLRSLKATGVRTALGQFDSGYSSLTYLHRYPFDILKIDRTLVVGAVPGGDDTDRLSRTLTQLGRVFDVDVVVEGSAGDREVDPPDRSGIGLSPAGSR
jgi:diguanylate cyclase (GGDEF)-like protein